MTTHREEFGTLDFRWWGAGQGGPRAWEGFGGV